MPIRRLLPQSKEEILFGITPPDGSLCEACVLENNLGSRFSLTMLLLQILNIPGTDGYIFDGLQYTESFFFLLQVSGFEHLNPQTEYLSFFFLPISLFFPLSRSSHFLFFSFFRSSHLLVLPIFSFFPFLCSLHVLFLSAVTLPVPSGSYETGLLSLRCTRNCMEAPGGSLFYYVGFRDRSTYSPM